MSHRHSFAALWWNFGHYGRQDVHMHPCAAGSCDIELVGLGRDCEGPTQRHNEVTLTSNSRWGDRSNEGKRLPGTPRASAALADSQQGGGQS